MKYLIHFSINVSYYNCRHSAFSTSHSQWVNRIAPLFSSYTLSLGVDRHTSTNAGSISIMVRIEISKFSTTYWKRLFSNIPMECLKGLEIFTENINFWLVQIFAYAIHDFKSVSIIGVAAICITFPCNDTTSAILHQLALIRLMENVPNRW